MTSSFQTCLRDLSNAIDHTGDLNEHLKNHSKSIILSLTQIDSVSDIYQRRSVLKLTHLAFTIHPTLATLTIDQVVFLIQNWILALDEDNMTTVINNFTSIISNASSLHIFNVIMRFIATLLSCTHYFYSKLSLSLIRYG